MKKCRQCRKDKPDSEYHIRQVICRDCLNAKRRASRKSQAKNALDPRCPPRIDMDLANQVLRR